MLWAIWNASGTVELTSFHNTLLLLSNGMNVSTAGMVKPPPAAAAGPPGYGAPPAAAANFQEGPIGLGGRMAGEAPDACRTAVGLHSLQESRMQGYDTEGGCGLPGVACCALECSSLSDLSDVRWAVLLHKVHAIYVL